MDNLLVLPSPETQDANITIADWVELSALFSADGGTSREDVVRALRRDTGLTDTRAQELANDVFRELSDRAKSAAVEDALPIATYPFRLERSDTHLKLNELGPSRRWDRGFIYTFLLTMTRSSMSSRNRTHAGVDPTKVFERLCADVLGTFWGGMPPYSGSMVFGTSSNNSTAARTFKSKIETLCTTLGEGGGWREGAIPPGGGDGKLDVVAWRKFRDGRQGGLIGFAQCKTGLGWDNHLTTLQPKAFCRKFMKQPLVLEPVRVYMVPNRIGSHVWENHTDNAGLLFDRCRIVQYAESIDNQVLIQARKWMDAVVKQQQLGMSKLRTIS